MKLLDQLKNAGKKADGKMQIRGGGAQKCPLLTERNGRGKKKNGHGQTSVNP